jgi:hypothetical protein
VDTQKKLTGKKSVKSMPDLIDRTHFCDAAYAEVLVSQDDNFRAIAAKAIELGKLPLKVVSFDDFARAIL